MATINKKIHEYNRLESGDAIVVGYTRETVISCSNWAAHVATIHHQRETVVTWRVKTTLIGRAKKSCGEYSVLRTTIDCCTSAWHPIRLIDRRLPRRVSRPGSSSRHWVRVRSVQTDRLSSVLVKSLRIASHIQYPCPLRSARPLGQCTLNAAVKVAAACVTDASWGTFCLILETLLGNHRLM